MGDWMTEANRRLGGAKPVELRCDHCRKERPRPEVRFFQLGANLRSSGLVANARGLFLCTECWEGKG